MTPEQYVQDKAARSGSSFYYAFLFLPPPRRAAITAFYAFCREVDDVVDEVIDPGVAATKLAWWRSEVAASFAGNADPSGDAGADAAHRRLRHRAAAPAGGDRGLPDGPRPVALPRLRRPGALLPPRRRRRRRGRGEHLRPHERHRPSRYAHRLGLAMQLTNIIRDVGDDARRGRIYLPMDELKQFDVKAHELLERRLQRTLHRADALPGRARAPLLRRGAGAAARADRRAQKPGLMMANIYRTLLREIEADGFQVLHQRISLTPLRKLWIAMRTQLARAHDGRMGVANARRRRRRAAGPASPRPSRRTRAGPRGHAVRDGAAARRPRPRSDAGDRRRSTTASTSASAPTARRCA